MSSKSEKMVQDAIIASIKKEFVQTKWWGEVQEDVRTRLGWIVENIHTLGPLFAFTYMGLFRWQYECRRAEGKNVNSPMASYLSSIVGMRISEEAFQCGHMPTRAILDLYDYVEPNDSDVAACLFLCHQVEILQKTGMLKEEINDLRTNASEMAQLLRPEKPKKKRPRPVQEETINWDDDESSENLGKSGELN